MRTNRVAVFVGGLAILALPAGLVHAQGPGPGGPGGGFGWGPRSGVRVLDARAGGCMFEERGPGKNSAADFAYSLSEVRAVFSGYTGPTPPVPPAHTVIHANKVSYAETTLSSRTLVCINDPANHARYIVNLKSLSPPTGTALEFVMGDRPRPDGKKPPQGGGQAPPWAGKANPNITHFTITSVANFAADGVTLTSAQTTALTAAFATWTTPSGDPPCTTLSLTVFKHGDSQDAHVICTPLGVDVFSLIDNPYVNSTVTATFVTPAPTPVIMLPLSNYSDIKVKVVNGGPGGPGGRHRGGPGGPGGPGGGV